jgi:hypothetical protein
MLVLTLRQLLHLDHMRYTVASIQTKIERLDNANKPPEDMVTETVDSIHLGSPKGVDTVKHFAKDLGDHGAATFRQEFEKFLNSFYQESGLPRDKYLKVHGKDQVTQSFYY